MIAIQHRVAAATVAFLQQPGNLFCIPVKFDPKSSGIAFARGLWPRKWIAVGHGWLGLTTHEQQAVLMHEAGHCRLWHKEIRLLLLPFAWCEWAQAIARAQEHAADAFAVRQGHGFGMLQFMHRAMRAEWGRHDRVGPPTLDEILDRALSPRAQERIRNILLLAQGTHHEKLAA